MLNLFYRSVIRTSSTTPARRGNARHLPSCFDGAMAPRAGSVALASMLAALGVFFKPKPPPPAAPAPQHAPHMIFLITFLFYFFLLPISIILMAAMPILPPPGWTTFVMKQSPPLWE
ncbi:hypothetical protein [Janthinobacterium fluminis]|uniref:Transmembrane protein n=1 Tax=Janthinobacterium fluminis TaxID=2987524 RepID=A0ABT5JVY5_9BURK|nr:hypothetical protein [Janthinobacterium fluminis]MDC8756340.1 hypothetical protein [Janthinobacterium fluminis]